MTTGLLRVASGLLFFCTSAAASPALAEGAATATIDPEIVQLEGRAECLLPEDELQSPDADCNQPGAPYAFRTSDDRLFYLIDGDPKSEVFIDPRIRRQPIVLEGWIRPQERFEILMVYTLIDEQPHHVHYRCDVCDIDATAPAPAGAAVGSSISASRRPLRSRGPEVERGRRPLRHRTLSRAPRLVQPTRRFYRRRHQHRIRNPGLSQPWRHLDQDAAHRLS